MKFRAKYATRNSKGKEVHRSFQFTVGARYVEGLEDKKEGLRAHAQWILRNRASYVPGRDVVYAVKEVE